MQHKFFASTVLIVFSFFIFSGCSDPDSRFVKVEGTITHNGQAVEGAAVTFGATEAGGESATGTTDASGNYTLTSSGATKQGTGALPGEYVVRVTKTVSKAELDPDEEAFRQGKIPIEELEKRRQAKTVRKIEYEELLPKKYSLPHTTPLKATVAKGGGKKYDFDLTDD